MDCYLEAVGGGRSGEERREGRERATREGRVSQPCQAVHLSATCKQTGRRRQRQYTLPLRVIMLRHSNLVTNTVHYNSTG